MVTTYTLLPTYKQEIKELTNNLKYLQEKEIVEIISSNVNNYLHIDIKKLLTKLIEQSLIDDVYNPKRWLLAHTLDLLNNKREEIIKYDSVNPIPLYERFRELGFSGNSCDKYVIEDIANNMLEFVSADEICELTENIINYMISKNEKTYDKFVDYLMKSKLVRTKCQMDIVTLKKKAERDVKEMEELINDTYRKSPTSAN